MLPHDKGVVILQSDPTVDNRRQQNIAESSTAAQRRVPPGIRGAVRGGSIVPGAGRGASRLIKRGEEAESDGDGWLAICGMELSTTGNVEGRHGENTTLLRAQMVAGGAVFFKGAFEGA
jgi:hypothetical protein